MQAHGPLTLALIALIGVASQAASAAGIMSIVRPSVAQAGPGAHRLDFGSGRDHAVHRRGDLGAALFVAPNNFEPPAASPESTPSLPQFATAEPLVIAAPACVPPKPVEAQGAHIIYVSEALAAPSRERGGVTIIYGRPNW